MKIFFRFFFIISGVIYSVNSFSQSKTFSVLVDSPAYRQHDLTILADYEMSRDTTFCRGVYMPRPTNSWKCLNKKKKYCTREYSCQLTNKIWNRKTEYRKTKKKIKDEGLFRGAPINVTFVKKIDGKYEDDVSIKDAAVMKTNTAYGDYVVKKGDTLMKVAFQVYGDVKRWRDIYRLNFFRLNKMTKLDAGVVLKYEKQGRMIVRNKGRPYYIKWGDNLHVIAHRVYGNKEMWKTIWKNNPQMIKNPNLIYADFTLYYPNPNEEEDIYQNVDQFY